MFYAYQLFQRPNKYKLILRGSCLFHHYCFDQYYKAESERLDYLCRSQHSIWAADHGILSKQLGDSRNVNDEAEAVRTSRFFILQSTYIGEYRYMRQIIHDIIAISDKVWYAHLFLTMTCNPQWP